MKWEYYEFTGRSTESCISISTLNKLGQEGWELCGCFKPFESISMDTLYYFKRPVNEKELGRKA
jgi:hypothetical protein